jgi:MFS family permease
MTALLLNVGHALDHLFLLIFATAVAAIAQDFGFQRWEDLMPYTAGAFVMFGLGSIPAGRLGDLWGRRRMMLVFYVGIGLASLSVAATQSPWQMAVALTVLGLFSSIYHPVGIPLLVQGSPTPGRTIGVNGLAGNMGIALAALSTGFWVQYLGWRMAFVAPALLSLGCGYLFWRHAPSESAPPARKAVTHVHLPKHLAQRTVVVMIGSAIASSLLFNFTTNGNAQLLAERLEGLVSEPAVLGLLLAMVYAIASFAQVVVGRLLDSVPIKPLLFGILAAQALVFGLAAQTSGWLWYASAIVYMISVFAAIPFNDLMVVRYIDDSMRSRVSGFRIAVAFGISSLAVYMLGPLVKQQGFTSLMWGLSIIAAAGACIVIGLPGEAHMRAARQP